MSPQTDDMQNNARKDSVTESCFGGFSGRISYERFGKNSGTRFGVKLFFVGCICIFAGVFLALCGLLMYQVVQSNKGLYYSEKQESADASEAVPATAAVMAAEAETTSPADVLFDDVTPAEAVRYGVPEGVMVRDAALACKYLSPEILEGDIITALGDTPVLDAEMLYTMLTDGDQVCNGPIMLFRNNESIAVTPIAAE